MCALRFRLVTTWLVLLSRIGPVEAVENGWERLERWRDVVRVEGACELPGVSIKYDTFVPAMWKAVQGGFVSHDDAVFCGEGLRDGFTCGVDVKRVSGHRWFANYQSAVEHRSPVTSAVLKRVSAEKTVDLGKWCPALAAAVRAQHVASIIFPMGAVPKNQLLEPGAFRPTDDHTRTGLNAATDLTGLAHSLTAYSDIARFLKHNFFMRVSDVDAAFPLLPFHPSLWQFMYFRFFPSDSCDHLHLYAHVCGDFGTAGMPGVFKRFFDVVVGMARAVHVLTLPMAVYVDDCALIGAIRGAVDREMVCFHHFAATVCGVYFKAIKDRVASQEQLVLGFVWDSRTLTRALEAYKLESYLQLLSDLIRQSTWTLREMQSLAGKMQRGCL